METKLIFENWRQFINEENQVDISSLTPEEQEQLKDAVGKIKAWVMGALKGTTSESLEEARPGRKGRKKKRAGQVASSTKRIVRSLISQGVLTSQDINKKREDLTPAEQKSFDSAVEAGGIKGDFRELMSGDFLEQVPGIQPASSLANLLQAVVGSKQINLSTLMQSPLADLFGAVF
jgi:hypothetical protein|tara:strand:- start:57 stop:587 length:531 start_codon:yes stop_codon:yes gene_type:complete